MKRRFVLVSPWCLEQTQRGEGVARVVTVGRGVARLRGLHPVRGSRSRTHETMRLLRDYETTRLGVTRRPGITIHWDLLHTSLGVLEISCVLVSSLFHVPVFHVLVCAVFFPMVLIVVFVDFQVFGLAQRRTWTSTKNQFLPVYPIFLAF